MNGTRLVSLFLLGACLVLGPPAPAVGQAPAPALPYVYPVKYLCSYLEPMPTVFHWTDINVLNPAGQRVATVEKKFVVSGTQDRPTSVQPVRDRFQLKPNQAASIDCDEIQMQLKVPLSTPMEGFVEIRSNIPLTVVGIYDKCVPQERADIFMSSTVRTDLRIDGLVDARDLTLVGPAIVKKGEMRIDREHLQFLQPTELVSMELEGELALGERKVPVRLIESPAFQSEGRIVGEVDRQTLAPVFPARSTFDVFFEISSTDPAFQERFGRLYNVEATRVQAVITGIPPGRPAERVPHSVDRGRLMRLFPDAQLVAGADGGEVLLVPTAEAAPVEDAINQYCAAGPTPIFSARSPAQPVGQVSNHCHDPNPPTPPPPEHVKVPCENASIDVEYIQPLPRGRQ